MIRTQRAAFTATEMVFVLVMVAVIIATVVPEFGRVEARWNVTGARDTFVMMAARARAEASARGVTVHLTVDPGSDRAWIVTDTDDTVEVRRFTGEFNANVLTETGGAITVCYASRGVALPSCTTEGLPEVVTFTLGRERAAAEVHPLGQVVSP